jgi:hypothetical protein
VAAPPSSAWEQAAGFFNHEEERAVNDDEILDALRELDEDEDVTVTSWEAEFIESVVFKGNGRLTQRQGEKALEILSRYGRTRPRARERNSTECLIGKGGGA